MLSWKAAGGAQVVAALVMWKPLTVIYPTPVLEGIKHSRADVDLHRFLVGVFPLEVGV